jgi:hypothetical protein
MASHSRGRAVRHRDVRFRDTEFRDRHAVLVAIFYLLGMATGGSLFALLRRSIARSRLNAMNKS